MLGLQYFAGIAKSKNFNYNKEFELKFLTVIEIVGIFWPCSSRKILRTQHFFITLLRTVRATFLVRFSSYTFTVWLDNELFQKSRAGCEIFWDHIHEISLQPLKFCSFLWECGVDFILHTYYLGFFVSYTAR